MEREYTGMTFHLDHSSGVAPYLQIVQQVKHALMLDMLRPGDQLPTLREVVESLAINPNTVMKAYRDLEREGLIGSRPGQGTFVLQTLVGPAMVHQEMLRTQLEVWVRSALEVGYDREGLNALFETTVYHVMSETQPTQVLQSTISNDEERALPRREDRNE